MKTVKLTVARCMRCGELTVMAAGQAICPTYTCRNTKIMPVGVVSVPAAGVRKALKEAKDED